MSEISIHSDRFSTMGTRAETHLFGALSGDAEQTLALVRRIIEAVDDALTIHRPSATTELNARLASDGFAPIDDELLLGALRVAGELHALTLGLFDVTAGSYPRGWTALHFDFALARVTADAPVAFDFGGVGKGLALDRAAAALRRMGVSSAMLSLGESSILALGTHPLGPSWPIAIPHPLRPDAFLVELEIADAAVSISSTVGAAARAALRSPSLRPATGAAVTQPLTTVAVDKSGARAEALSTALLVGAVQGRERLRRQAPDAQLHAFAF